MRNKELVEKYREVRKELHVAFMKLEKMYYKVCREEPRRVLCDRRVEEYLIMAVKRIYNGCKVTCQG